MMKKTFKQLLGLTLSAVMVISMAGCGNNNATTTTENPEVSTTGGDATQTTEAATPELTYPLDTDETMTLWTSRINVNGDYKDYKESPFHTGLSKVVGVDIEWSFPNAGQPEGEAYSILMTEDTLPDVIFRVTNNADLKELYNDGVIYDLKPYLEEYAPDYWAYITAPGNEDIYRNIVTEDGNVFAVWALREEFNCTYQGPMIRQDWLDECGLNAPVTLEDWENVLTKFKEKYNATLGCASSTFLYPFFASGTGAYATTPNYDNNAYFVDDEGVLQCSILQPEWLEYMKVLNRWYKLGLIDNDSTTASTAVVRTKAANNQIGASWGAMSQLTNFVNDAEASGSGAKWVGVSYPRTAVGEPTSVIGYGTLVLSSGAFVTKSCSEEKLATVLKVLNYGYTEEGMMYWNFGDEGVSYTAGSDGKLQWTDTVLNDAQGVTNAISKYSGAGTAPIGVQLAELVQMKNSEIATEAVNTWIENTDVRKHYFPNAYMVLTEDEKLAYTDTYAALFTYIQETTQKYIMGTESLEDIEEFYAQLDKMGLDDCLEIQRAAYARYLNK